MEIAEVAQTCHEANRVVQAINGDVVAEGWDILPIDQQERIMNGVTLKLKHPETTPAQMHENWLADMRADGYTVGPIIDHQNRQHPCLVDYDDLPLEQKIKDDLFSGIVGSLRDYVT